MFKNNSKWSHHRRNCSHYNSEYDKVEDSCCRAKKYQNPWWMHEEHRINKVNLYGIGTIEIYYHLSYRLNRRDILDGKTPFLWSSSSDIEMTNDHFCTRNLTFSGLRRQMCIIGVYVSGYVKSCILHSMSS